MSERDPAEFRPVQRDATASRTIIGLLVVVAVAAAAWWWYSTQRQAPAPAVAPPAASAPPTDGTPPPTAPVASGPQFPIDAPADTSPPADADAQVAQALAALLGQPAVASFLQIDGFARRLVATVDSLPREQAAARMWPVQPTPKRFATTGEGADPQRISPDNASRYAPFVAFVDKVDTAKAVAVYIQLYPRFQQAYEELGYPKRYFNDRLVAVIDHLLQAPEPAGPLQVKLTEVKGEIPSAQPWTRYEFADPQLEALSAGQKMLVRMGPANEKRLKAKLIEFRAGVVAGAVGKR
ncbi:DUF3014 domain-containing protein [Variovorax sp. J22G21]|uniref:DUF3014 domain-containing protein n=1 Tax=Variovorax fucosicus TaxID=3053517 RepID=UPI002575C5A4|nr:MULTISPECIES: DUF3014 domain-containing protein [unclassified Variovorax]MDM0041663.1 DUF3014 domain-containing protein [Variovorax sp. J22R193]MDM0060719.1 DUF3014 domain-containing protein [Variovorax sp. J22G21]